MSAIFSGGVDVFGLSDVGKKRQRNEDHFVIATLRKEIALRQTNLEDTTVFDHARGTEAQLLAVADGVGGQAGGDVASRTAVTSLVAYLNTTMSCFNNLDVDAEHEFLEKLENGVHAAHEDVRVANGRLSRPPATTLTMITLVWPRAYVVHVGDSRAMYLHDGWLRPLTRDQTMGEAMVDAGAMTEEQASRSSLSQTLYSALGGTDMMPHVGLVDFAVGDVLLMCSDGLTKHVSDTRISEVLGQPWTAEQMTRTLVQDALDGGGSDNVTVIVARMTG
jgi:protein phosphatase